MHLPAGRGKDNSSQRGIRRKNRMPLFYCILVKWVSDCYNLIELTDSRLRWYGQAKISVRLQNSKPLQSHIFGMCGTGIIIQGRIIHGLTPEMPVPDWYQFDTGVDLRIWDVWDYPRKNGILRDLKPSDGLIFIPICRVGIKRKSRKTQCLQGFSDIAHSLW